MKPLGTRLVSASASASSVYLRVCELSEGGMGGVELALRSDGRFQRLYAVKRLHPPLRTDSQFRNMFLDEARIAGLIRHPNVVSVLDVGDDAQGPFLVMQYIEGVSCLQLIDQVANVGPLPVQIAARICAQAARGLHAAHDLIDHEGTPLGIVHRDVSPANILVGYDGLVRVTDFGVAKALGGATKTITGVVKGKLGYMSPEQLMFLDLDRRADLFALGIVLYELLSGERLYPNGSDGPRRILHDPPPDIADVRDDVPPDLVDLLFSLLAKNRSDRPENAATVAQILEDLVEQMAPEEGSVDVSTFVNDLFRDHRKQERVRVDEALRRARREDGTLDLDISIQLADEVTEELSYVRTRSRPWPPRLAVLGMVLAAGLGGAGLASLLRAEPTGSSPPRKVTREHLAKPLGRTLTPTAAQVRVRSTERRKDPSPGLGRGRKKPGPQQVVPKGQAASIPTWSWDELEP